LIVSGHKIQIDDDGQGQERPLPISLLDLIGEPKVVMPKASFIFVSLACFHA